MGIPRFASVLQSIVFRKSLELYKPNLNMDELQQYKPSRSVKALAVFFMVWYSVILYVSLNGVWEAMLKFSSKKILPVLRYGVDQTGVVDEEEDDEKNLPGVSILRPLKGIDTEMKQCLESSFLQRYPTHKYEIIFCVESSNDEAVNVVQKLIEQYPRIDAKVMIGQTNEQNEQLDHFGPNPKINNLAKGYFNAKFDILWVLDSNVWTSSGTLARSVVSFQASTDNGRKTSRPVKLVHHTPLAVSISPNENYNGPSKNIKELKDRCGAKLDEMFLLTSHAKFYISFNNISIAPCVNGKSNLYRRSDLDYAVKQIANSAGQHREDARKYSSFGHGIRYFAKYIGEDNMIGEALWKYCNGRTGMTGDVVVQPLGGGNKTTDYIQRRVRWLRVRKYMVLAATLVEPTTESLVSGVYGTFAVSNLFLGVFFCWKFFFVHMIIWCLIDYFQFNTLIKYASLDEANDFLPEDKKPFWIKVSVVPSFGQVTESLKLFNWLGFWALREALALPIWVIAMMGHEIDWRNRPFRIKADLTAEEL